MSLRDIKENLYAGMVISMLIMGGFASLFLIIPENYLAIFFLIAGFPVLFIFADKIINFSPQLF